MENLKMNELTDTLKAFEQLTKMQRSRQIAHDINIELLDDDSPAGVLYQAAGMLMDCSMLVGKAAFLVSLLENDEEDEADDDDEENDEPCGNCPYEGACGSEYGTMVLVAHPDGDNTIMTMEELAEEIGEIAGGQIGTYDMKPIPGTEDLYYTIAEKKPLKRAGRTYYKSPAVIFGIDEDAGEVVSPNAGQLYTAARYFEDHSTKLKTREGEVSVFCFD